MATSVSRRDFLKTATMAAAAIGGVVPRGVAAAEPQGARRSVPGPALIDVNVTLSRWPLRRLPLDETRALVAKLRRQGVTQAWAGSFEGVLDKDLAAANSRLADECRRHGRGMLVPFGTVNPTLPDWQEDVRRCHEEHKMPGLRLYPGYHGYGLGDPVFATLLSLAAGRGLILQLVVGLEDERTQGRLMRAPAVEVAALAGLLRTQAEARIVLLNGCRWVKGPLLASLAKTGQVCCDIATLEGVGGVANLLREVPTDCVLFGSCAPLFYFESARLKLQESVLNEDQMAAVCGGNARRLLREGRGG